MVQKSDPNSKLIAENRRARFDYAIEEDLEAGIVLQGSEVKALRHAQANIAESYASVEDGELWLINCYIVPYGQADKLATRSAGGASCWSRSASSRSCGTRPGAMA